MDELERLASKLISIPSVNPMGRDVSGPEFLETALTDFLEDWLRPLDLEVRRQPVGPGRDNLLATYHSDGAGSRLLMEVHQDTVPVDGMTIDPFAPRIDGNRLYGRGACDNKGPMAAMLIALKRLAEEKPAGAASVTLALTVDEEHTFLGVRELVRQGLAFDAAVVAEPTDLDVVVAHKGVCRWHVFTEGKACHSATPDRGQSAIYRMAPVLVAIERYAERLAREPGNRLLGGPTISVGRIEGGVSVNTVPDHCRIEIDRRLIPGETPENVQADLKKSLADDESVEFEVGFEKPWLELLPMGDEINAPLSEALGKSVDAVRGSHRTHGVSYGTDAASINAAGVPAVVFGPGSIGKAHTKDEWVPLEEIRMAGEIYFDFCARGAAVSRAR